MRKKIIAGLLLTVLVGTSVPLGGLQTYAVEKDSSIENTDMPDSSSNSSSSSKDSSDSSSSSSSSETMTPQQDTLQPVNIAYQAVSIPDKIYAGDTFNIAFQVAKDGSTEIEEGTAYAEISAPDGFSLSANTNRIYLKELKNNGVATYYIPCEASADAAGKKGSFTVTIYFNYYEKVGNEKVKKAGTNTYTTQVAVQKIVAPKLMFANGKQSSIPDDKEDFEYTFDIGNYSDKYSIDGGTIKVETSTGLAAADSTDTIQIPAMSPGAKTKATLKLKTIEGMTEKEYITLSYTYTYTVGGSSIEVSNTEKFNIKTKVTEKKSDSYPSVILDQYSYGKNVKYGGSVDLKVRFKNESKKEGVKNLVISAATSEGLVSKDASNKILADNLGTEKTIEKKLKFDVKKDLASGYQTVTFTIRYQYMKDGALTDVETTETANIYVEGNPELDNKDEEKSAIATPYLMVDSYDFGGEKVAAGSTFTLKMNIKNTSTTVGMENIAVSLTPSEDLTVADASNTFYISSLAPGEIVTKEIDISALPTAKSQSSTIALESKYEFISDKTRQSATGSEQISIPVYQEDRMELSLVENLEDTYVGSEHTLSIQYANKGKGTVYNVSAVASGNFELAEKSQNLGNFEPGANGTIDFFPVSNEPGEVSGKVVVTYEDESGKQKNVSVPFSYTVQEMNMDGTTMGDDFGGDMMDDPDSMTTSGSAFNPLFVVIPVGAVVIVLIVVLVIRSKKKKKEKEKMLLDELSKIDEED